MVSGPLIQNEGSKRTATAMSRKLNVKRSRSHARIGLIGSHHFDNTLISIHSIV